MRLGDLHTDKLNYFAYGMLTNPDNMRNAKFLGSAILNHHDLEFNLFANIVSGRGKVVGCLWQIDQDFLDHLDMIEGYPDFYTRKTVQVFIGSDVYKAEVYQMTNQSRLDLLGREPGESYLNSIKHGYQNAGIPLTQITSALKN